jgi:hypothetical protein
MDGEEHAMADGSNEPGIDRDDRRRLAAELFNLVWTMLETPDRTPDQDERMLHAAHASRFHWGETGTPVNVARGDWQVSRVYAVLGRAEPALHHAHRCLATCRDNRLDGFDLGCVYEALARASLVAGRDDDAVRYAELARGVGSRISDDEDRDVLLGDLADLPA